MKIRVKLIIVCLSLIVLTTLSVSLFSVRQTKKDIVSSVKAKATSDLATTLSYAKAKYPGEWRVEGNKLFKGKLLLNGNYAVVDEISKLTGDLSTVFLKETRITTTVKKPDGSRAVGTKAAADVIQTVLVEGKDFIGEAVVVDQKIQTAYTPIKDSTGKIIGMWFVGVPKSFIDKLILNTILGVSGVGFVIILIGIVAAVIVARYFEVPILAMMKAMKSAEDGHLDIDVDIKSKDEIGILAKSFTNMMTKYRTFFGDVQGAVEQVKSTSDTLRSVSTTSVAEFQQVVDSIKQLAATNDEENASAKETFLVTEQLEQAIEQIAKGAQEQAQNVSQTSELVTGMAEEMEQVAASAKDVDTAVQNTEQVAEQGKTSVEKTIEGMNMIKTTVYQSAEHIKKLGEHSQHIGEIVEIIDDIAEQTNLLALNAAIEAARAGEHGKGFAVVADEVRKLAERSGKATKEITDLINTIQQLTGKAVSDMEMGTKEVEHGSELADEAGTALNEILRTVAAVKKQIQSITGVTENITASSSKVVSATSNIAAITEENGAATQEMAASSSEATKSVLKISRNIEEAAGMTRQVNSSMEKMSLLAQEISASANNLEETVVNLQKSVNVFKI